MLGKLAALHPDCSDHPGVVRKYRLYFSAPYSSAQLGQGGAARGYPPHLARGVPCSLTYAVPLEDRWQSYAEPVEKGDVLLFPPWFDAPENSIVQILYREAALRKSDTIQGAGHGRHRDAS